MATGTRLGYVHGSEKQTFHCVYLLVVWPRSCVYIRAFSGPGKPAGAAAGPRATTSFVPAPTPTPLHRALGLGCAHVGVGRGRTGRGLFPQLIAVTSRELEPPPGGARVSRPYPEDRARGSWEAGPGCRAGMCPPPVPPSANFRLLRRKQELAATNQPGRVGAAEHPLLSTPRPSRRVAAVPRKRVGAVHARVDPEAPGSPRRQVKASQPRPPDLPRQPQQPRHPSWPGARLLHPPWSRRGAGCAREVPGSPWRCGVRKGSPGRPAALSQMAPAPRRQDPQKSLVSDMHCLTEGKYHPLPFFFSCMICVPYS